MANVNFDVSTADRAIIRKISTRAIKLIEGLNLSSKLPSRTDIAMDITATHANGLPLRLSDMLGADKFDFLHDIAGISKHLDRETGKLTEHFRPRFAVPSDALIAEAQGAK
ncbi:hypothetical protein [Asaia sp. VD9]|uniref:DUF6874 family protein n=1 Tax=Asaia sp. VD9 TaxID=3081235 RepID=UPI0030172E2E